MEIVGVRASSQCRPGKLIITVVGCLDFAINKSNSLGSSGGIPVCGMRLLSKIYSRYFLCVEKIQVSRRPLRSSFFEEKKLDQIHIGRYEAGSAAKPSSKGAPKKFGQTKSRKNGAIFGLLKKQPLGSSGAIGADDHC